MGGTAKHFVSVRTKEELLQAIVSAKKQELPFHILGKGTNTVFHHHEVNKFIIKNEIMGIEIIDSEDANNTNDSFILIKIGAGVHWDDVVAFAVEHNLSGIEALSAIPGSAGATPVQNVGAYGQEIKNRLVEVEALDTEALQKSDPFIILSNSECEFSYRDSIFKKPENKNRYIITSITLKLSKTLPQIPNYPGVKEYFIEHNLDTENPTLSDIRNAIIHIRKSKLPDPSIVPNCGSFFKNAIVCKEHFDAIQKSYPTIPHFDVGHHGGKDLIKIPTGWLLEQAGFKDKPFGNFKTHDKNAVVMTHIGDGTLDELKETVQTIQNKIKEMFGVEIEMEVNVVE
jgi:UDP-N-acetylmuramate dehydrogenase